MNTQRILGRAWGTHWTRWTIGLVAVPTFLLLTACADCIAESAPEVIPYCAELTGSPPIEPPSGCIAQP